MVVVHAGLWWFVVVCGSSVVALVVLSWFELVSGGSWLFMVVRGDLWWCMVLCGGSVALGGLLWFMVV